MNSESKRKINELEATVDRLEKCINSLVNVMCTMNYKIGYLEGSRQNYGDTICQKGLGYKMTKEALVDRVTILENTVRSMNSSINDIMEHKQEKPIYHLPNGDIITAYSGNR